MKVCENRDVVIALKLMDGDEEFANADIAEGGHEGEWVDIDIPKGKEIIGFVTNTENQNLLQSVGLQLWTPNPKAL